MKKLATLALASLVLVGCAQNKQQAAAKPAANASMGIVNSKCPMMPEHAAGSSVTVDYNGQKVGLCCKGCISGWNKLTEAEKADRLAKAK